MIGKEVIKSEPMPSSKVKEIIEDFADTNELNYQQNLTLNHLARFKRYSAEDAEEIYEKLQELLGIEGGQCTPDGKFSLDACRCIGACGLAPVLTINDDVYGRLTAADMADVLAKYE